MVRELVAAATPKLDKAVEHFAEDIKSLRTGRAHVSMLDGVMVEYYGVLQPLKAVASVNTPDGRTIAIAPWDKGAMAPIEKAIRENQALGFNPMNDGQVIRVNVPALTEDRRKEIVKTLGSKVEDCRITLRNIRHDTLNEMKRLEKAKEATTDDVKALENELGKLLDKYQAKIDELEKVKTQEIMAV